MNVISVRSIDEKFFRETISRASDFKQELKTRDYEKTLKNCLVTLCFFEPSTRTYQSFQTAAKHLGAEVNGFESAKSTSVQKGETLADTLRNMQSYNPSCIIMRHPAEGSAKYAAEILEVPVINAGDGANQHPTQTMLDVFTIEEQGGLDDKKISLVGDLKHARTMHSLPYGIGLMGYENVTMNFVSPPGLEMPGKIIREIREYGFEIVQSNDLLSASDSDFVYACRIQKERFEDRMLAEQFQEKFRLDDDFIKRVENKGMKILHPLPIAGEISPSVYETRHAHWFTQSGNGVPVRMTLLNKVISNE